VERVILVGKGAFDKDDMDNMDKLPNGPFTKVGPRHVADAKLDKRRKIVLK